jgi:hypothetical protein
MEEITKSNFEINDQTKKKGEKKFEFEFEKQET